MIVRPSFPCAVLPTIALALAMNSLTLSASVLSAQGQVDGSVRDSLAGTPVAGVIVSLDGRLVQVTDAGGAFRVRLGEPGTHRLGFSHPRYRPVLKSIDFEIEVGTDSTPTRLEVRWPTLETLIDQACGSKQAGRVAVLGSIRGDVRSGRTGAEAAISWGRHKTDQAVGDAVVPIGADGSFLACGLPGNQEVEFRAIVDQVAGPVRRVRTPLVGFVEVEAVLP